jgi:hypothetical protein
MVNPKWESTGIYEHPAKHQAGRFGKVVLSQAGVYAFASGGSMMSCCQDWAAKIHHDETTKSDYITIRVTPGEKTQIEADAKAAGLDNVSAYLIQLYRKARQ